MVRQLLATLVLLCAISTTAATTECQILVHFEKDKSILTPEAREALDAFMATIRIGGDYSFSIAGHTDSDGSSAYNDALALARAEAVKGYLAERGVDLALITIGTFGESDPLATNRHEDGMALNRRVSITFTQHAYANTDELRRALIEGSVQLFSIDPTVDQMLQGKAGTQVWFKAGAFVDAQGRTVDGRVNVELTEARGLQAMLAHRLSTMSGERILETGGMLKVQATDTNGVPLRLAASTPMQVALPELQRQNGMELFVSDNGANWTTTGTALVARSIPRWVAPTPPFPPQQYFKWPHYRVDQTGRPVKPVEPAMPKRPAAPREESYAARRSWWSFLAPERAGRQSAARYQQALLRYQVQLDKYERKVAAYDSECNSFPDRIQHYTERLAEWNAQKESEYAQWRANVHAPALERYNALMAPHRARYDSLVANWEGVRKARMQEYARRCDSLRTGDLGGLNAYVFTTSELGWINCDRFYDVPEDRKQEVIVRADTVRDVQVFLVFQRINSLMGLGQRKDGRFVSPRVPRDGQATIFAYAVIDGRAHVAMRPVGPSGEEELEFRPSSYAEIGKLLNELGPRPG